MKMTIKTKRKNMLNVDLSKNTKYQLVGIIQDINMVSGIAVLIDIDYDSSKSFDSNFFRMNSIKIADN